jgi:Leucine-rich repeat (LRR) protein
MHLIFLSMLIGVMALSCGGGKGDPPDPTSASLPGRSIPSASSGTDEPAATPPRPAPGTKNPRDATLPPSTAGVLLAPVKGLPGESLEAYSVRLEELPLPGLDCRIDPGFDGKILCVITHLSPGLLSDLGKLDLDRIVISWNINHDGACPAFTGTALRQLSRVRHVQIPCELNLQDLSASLTNLETLSLWDFHSDKIEYLKDLRGLRSLRIATDVNRSTSMLLPSGLTDLRIKCPPMNRLDLAPELLSGLRHLDLEVHVKHDFEKDKIGNPRDIEACQGVPGRFQNLETLVLDSPHQVLSRLGNLGKLKKLVFRDWPMNLNSQTAEVFAGLPASLESAVFQIEMKEGELEKAVKLHDLLHLSWSLAPNRFGSFKDFKRLVSLEVSNIGGVLENRVFDAPALEVYRFKNHHKNQEKSPFTAGTIAQAKKLRVLELDNVILDGISWVGALTALEELKLNVDTKDPGMDLTMLGDLKNLKTLHLDINLELGNPEFLKKLVNLQELKLGRVMLEDLSFLSFLPRLRRLSLAGSTVKNWDDLKSAKNLEYLNLSRSNFSVAEPLGQLTLLRKLNLSGTPVKNLTGVGLLQKLLVVDISSTAVKSLLSLARAKNLREILAGGQYLDLEPVMALPLLRYFQTDRLHEENHRIARAMAETRPHFTMNPRFATRLSDRHFPF